MRSLSFFVSRLYSTSFRFLWILVKLKKCVPPNGLTSVLSTLLENFSVTCTCICPRSDRSNRLIGAFGDWGRAVNCSYSCPNFDRNHTFGFDTKASLPSYQHITLYLSNHSWDALLWLTLTEFKMAIPGEGLQSYSIIDKPEILDTLISFYKRKYHLISQK